MPAAVRCGRLFCCAMLLAGAARAAPAVYVDDVAPFAFTEGGVVKGVLYDMLSDLARRTAYSGRIMPVPLKRELLLVATQPGAVGTIGRFPEVEERYSWLCKLLDDRILLVANAATGVDISSVESARDLRLGVILGGPAEALARRLGFSHIEPVTTSVSNARKLAMGRLDVWMTTWGIAAHEQQRMGGDLKQLRSGAVLRPVQLYLAGARSMEPAQAAQWQTACAAMHKDGTHSRILRQYHY